MSMITLEILFILHHFQKTVQEAVFQREGLGEARQQFGLFIDVSNSRFQPMKPASMVHIENIYVKNNGKLMQIN